MAITASGNLTVTINSRKFLNNIQHNDVVIALATGSDADYPSGGIPMPAFSDLGFRRELNNFIMTDIGAAATGTLYHWEYSVTGKTIRGYNHTATTAVRTELATSVALTAVSFRGIAVGW